MALNGTLLTNGYYSSYSGDNIYLELSWRATQSIEKNTSSVYWELKGKRTASGYVNAGGFQVIIDGETVYSKGTDYRIELRNGTLVASGTKVISHNTDGARNFDAYIQGAIYTYAVNCSGRQTFTLDTIPRKSSMSAPNGTLDVAQYISVTKQSPTFSHTITYSCGTNSGTICTKDTRTSIPWTPSLELATAAPESQSVLVNFTITTYSGNTSVGTNTATARYSIPDNVKPYFSIHSFDPTEYADYYGGYIQGQSKLGIDIDAYGVYGSWIKTYRTILDGKTYTDQIVNTDVLSRSGEVTAYISVVDSRDRPVTAEKTINVIPYEYPSITKLSAYRSTEDGTAKADGSYITVKFSSLVYSLNDKNGAWYKIEYKKSSESTYTEDHIEEYTGQYSVANGTYTFAAEPTSYDIVLTVGDRFKSIPKAISSPAIKKVWSMLKKAGEIVGIAVGKLAELEGVFDIAYQTRFLGGILHSVLPTNTDLNTELTPKTYMLLSANAYSNTPETGKGAFLEIVGIKDGSLIQKYSVFDTTNPRVYERIHYATTGWGSWVCVRGDFVVEQGEKDGWIYQKWNSGIAECSKIVTLTTKITTVYGSMYVNDTKMSRQSYPFPFISKPVEIASLTSGNEAVWIYPENGGRGVNGGYASAIYSVCRPGSLSTDATFYISIHARGKWK